MSEKKIKSRKEVLAVKATVVKSPPLAADIVRPDGARPFRLERTEIRLWLTEEQARDRNSVLNEKTGKWRFDPKALVHQMKENPCPKWSWAERRRLAREAATKDELFYQKYLAHKDATATKADGPTGSAPTPGKALMYPKFHGFPITHVVRFCGHHGMSAKQTERLIKALRLNCVPATIAIQLRNGQKGRGDWKLPAVAVKEINAAIRSLKKK